MFAYQQHCALDAQNEQNYVWEKTWKNSVQT